jgi:hypothetical protein
MDTASPPVARASVKRARVKASMQLPCAVSSLTFGSLGTVHTAVPLAATAWQARKRLTGTTSIESAAAAATSLTWKLARQSDSSFWMNILR